MRGVGEKSQPLSLKKVLTGAPIAVSDFFGKTPRKKNKIAIQQKNALAP